jgi:hypothetical protein
VVVDWHDTNTPSTGLPPWRSTPLSEPNGSSVSVSSVWPGNTVGRRSARDRPSSSCSATIVISPSPNPEIMNAPLASVVSCLVPLPIGPNCALLVEPLPNTSRPTWTCAFGTGLPSATTVPPIVRPLTTVIVPASAVLPGSTVTSTARVWKLGPRTESSYFCGGSASSRNSSLANDCPIMPTDTVYAPGALPSPNATLPLTAPSAGSTSRRLVSPVFAVTPSPTPGPRRPRLAVWLAEIW